jgi:hypothetical protein
VDVAGTKVTIHMANLTQGTSFTRTLSMAAPDTSSADWIAEAPSVCGDSGYRCSQEMLTDFGSVAFTNATATSAGHTGSIADSAWQSAPVVLQSGAGGGFGGYGGGYGQFGQEQGVSEALPSTLAPGGDSFRVTWRMLSASQSQPSGGYGGYPGGGDGGGYPGGGYPGGGYGGGSPGGGYGV